MKTKLVAALCLCALILSLCSCAKAPKEAESSEPQAPPETTGEEHSVPMPVIPHNVTRADVDALPVANAEMTEEELRELCVNYMTLEKEVMWSVNKSMTYPCDWAGAADAKGNLHLTAGVLYRGMPYTGAHLDLQCFFDLLDEETGVVDTASFLNGASVSGMIGNTCNTSCYWAWARVSAIPYHSITQMTPENGYLPVGSYKSVNGKTISGSDDTPSICERNGEQVMFESYAMMKPADGMGTKSDDNVGHVRMVREAPVVVRNSDGSINGKESFVIVLEQTSKLVARETENGKAQAYSGEDNKYTFETLYRTNYIPFTFPELSGRASVQKAAVTFESEKTEQISDLIKASVSSNYAVSRVDVIFSDGSGNEIYRSGTMNSVHTANRVELKRVLHSRGLKDNLKNGEIYSVRVVARLANGETLIAFESSLPY